MLMDPALQFLPETYNSRKHCLTSLEDIRRSEGSQVRHCCSNVKFLLDYIPITSRFFMAYSILLPIFDTIVA